MLGQSALATKQDLLDEGYCVGTISAIRDVSTFLPPSMRSCPPVKIPLSQVMRVVIRFTGGLHRFWTKILKC
jgi:hypothetical protein